MTDVLIQLLNGLHETSPPSIKLCFKAIRLKLSSKSGLEEAHNVRGFHTGTGVTHGLSHGSLQAGAEMVKHALVIPSQVTGHSLELHKEGDQAPSAIVLLQLHERMCRLQPD